MGEPAPGLKPELPDSSAALDPHSQETRESVPCSINKTRPGPAHDEGLGNGAAEDRRAQSHALSVLGRRSILLDETGSSPTRSEPRPRGRNSAHAGPSRAAGLPTRGPCESLRGSDKTSTIQRALSYAPRSRRPVDTTHAPGCRHARLPEPRTP